jgi:hypothetical protein
MSKVAPKSFNQLRLAAQVTVCLWGSWVGMGQKTANDALWTAHYQQEWAAKAKIVNDAKAAADALKPEVIPDIIPAELHAEYRELKKQF